MLGETKNKFQRGMIYFFAALAVLGILPFCIIRFLRGEFLNAAIDLAIILVSIINAIYILKHGRATPIASYIASLLYSAGAVAVAYLNDPIFAFWLFPPLLANFFLLSAKPALIVNGLMIAAILPLTIIRPTPIETFAMIVSLLMCSAMAYVFAILTHKQQRMLEAVATQDPLTHLSNRRALDDEMRVSMQDFARNRTPVTLIMLDLDFFKMVNDKFGHNVGDSVLVDLAALLTKRTRKTDRAFRFGGEEFMILARNTSLTEAVVVAEQLRAQIETELSDPEGTLTASFGCAELRTGESAEDWFVRVDKAVYQAKQNGRNCVVAAD